MKNLVVTIKGDYSTESFEGTRKEVLNFLRKEALEMRKSSRQARGLDLSVHSLSDDEHPSKLVTMASFEINKKGIDSLLTLMSNHGVKKYSIK